MCFTVKNRVAWTGWDEVSGQARPDWFVAERQLLAGLYAAEQLPVQFDNTLAERIGGNFAYVKEPTLERLSASKRFVPLPVARSVDSPSVLVVNAGEPDKPRLYEGQWRTEQIDPAEFRPMVGSYAELLGHIAAALPPQNQIND